MRLTQWTDYALRVLMYCAAQPDRDTPVTVSEIAEHHQISRHHLNKIVQELSAHGWLETTRGRGGGLRLTGPASGIRVGDVVRATETDFTMVECFDPIQTTCRLNGQCRLKGVLHQAMVAYFAALDGATVADLVLPYPDLLPMG
jgi:Rrf2 family transcriptional regulator, nitric oxide-sensitive transcriptional repressor